MGPNGRRVKAIVPDDVGHDRVVMGRKGVRCRAGMKGAIARFEPSGRRAFEMKFGFTCENDVEFFCWMMMPRVVQMRRLIDDKAAHGLACKWRVAADDFVAGEPRQKIGIDVGAFVGFAPLHLVAYVDQSIAQALIGCCAKACFRGHQIGGRNVKRS